MLTKSEEEIMYLLWDLDEPLTSSEIVKKAVNKTWKKSYINLLINSLLKKDMIKVVGVKQMTKNYARTFVPTMTKDAYAIKQISDRPNFADSDIPTLFSELIEKTESSEIFDQQIIYASKFLLILVFYCNKQHFHSAALLFQKKGCFL